MELMKPSPSDNHPPPTPPAKPGTADGCPARSGPHYQLSANHNDVAIAHHTHTHHRTCQQIIPGDGG